MSGRSISPPLPWRELAPDRLRHVRGVVLDVDDTITRRGRLEPEAFDAMHCLAEAGVRLMAVTGRPLGWADVLARLLPVEAVVGENGAGWVWRDGTAIRDGYFQDDGERSRGAALLERVRELVAKELPDIDVANDQRARRCDLAFDVGESARVAPGQLDRLIALIESTGAVATVSSVHAHAMPGTWNKAVGTVRAAREVLGIDLDSERDRWVFVGDSGNDEPAFGYFPISVGVANVRRYLERMRSLPKYITAGERGIGFSQVAARVLSARL